MNSYTNHPSPNDNEIDLIEVASFAWRYKYIILLFTFIGLLSPLAFSLLKKSSDAQSYIASTVISFINDPITRQNQGPIFQEIIQSNSTFQKMNIPKKQLGNLEVEFMDRTGIMYINFQASTPDESLSVLNKLVEAVIQSLNEFQISPAFVIVDPPFNNGKRADKSPMSTRRKVILHFAGTVIGFSVGCFIAFLFKLVRRIREDEVLKAKFLNS